MGIIYFLMVKDHINPNITFLGEKNVTGIFFTSVKENIENIYKKRKNENKKVCFFIMSQ